MLDFAAEYCNIKYKTATYGRKLALAIYMIRNCYQVFVQLVINIINRTPLTWLQGKIELCEEETTHDGDYLESFLCYDCE